MSASTCNSNTASRTESSRTLMQKLAVRMNSAMKSNGERTEIKPKSFIRLRSMSRRANTQRATHPNTVAGRLHDDSTFRPRVRDRLEIDDSKLAIGASPRFQWMRSSLPEARQQFAITMRLGGIH